MSSAPDSRTIKRERKSRTATYQAVSGELRPTIRRREAMDLSCPPFKQLLASEGDLVRIPRTSALVKRTLDLGFSGLGLIVLLATAFPVIALIIKLDSRGPILFKQKRHGINGKVFTCLKFRTMKAEARPAFVQASRGDPRVTGVGKFLRRTNLDELPQLFNVFWGDMSLVGPRPHPIELDEHYAPLISGYFSRYTVKPGMTGLAQVNGHRGITEGRRAMRNRVRIDMLYIRNFSLITDIKLVVKTLILMIKGDSNAH